jgi:hypothetical protein
MRLMGLSDALPKPINPVTLMRETGACLVLNAKSLIVPLALEIILN